MVTSASHATPVAGPARAAIAPGAADGRARVEPWLVVAALTAVGAALRLVVANQSLFGDELSTYWIVSTNDLGGVVSIVHDRIEITPPLSFVLAWLATQVDLSAELLRAPSLIAGTAAIPIVYRLGRRTIGAAGALVAATLTALAPYMIYYSAEARGYQLMIVLVLLSTLSLLAALDSGRARWWVAYAACTCAAAYTHYTSVFALAPQLGWALWAHPEARRPVLLANAAAVVAFLPWLPGFLDDLDMPDSRIMSDFSPLTPLTARLAVEHWSVGYPYVAPTTELRDLPGVLGLALQAVGLALAIAGAATAAYRRRVTLHRRVVLVVAVALAVPLAEAGMTLIGTNTLNARNLAVGWPWFALALAALLVAAGPWLRGVAATLVIAGFALGAAKMVDQDFARPDFEAAAAIIDREATARDAVVDGAVAFISPGPLSGLDAALRRPHRIVRNGAPQQREGNFRIGQPVLDPAAVVRRAEASGGRMFVVSPEGGRARSAGVWDPLFAASSGRYRRASTRILPGFIPLAVHVYERP